MTRLTFPVWLRYRARGCERVPSDGGALLVVNHQSFLDPPIVGTALTRPVSFLARDSLFRLPVLGWMLKRTYVIPINRDSASSSTIRLAAQRMRDGFLVGIFPEGTRSEDGRIGPLKPGFIALIRRADVPVIPVGIAGSGTALPRDARFIRPRTCRIVFGEPIDMETIRALCGKGSEQALLDQVRSRMIQVQREAQDWLERNTES
jgi:1-acyl-sn-glycerol-3-phosphate acyltransferase